LVGLLEKALHETALDFVTAFEDERLDLVGEMLVLIGHGEGHLHAQFDCERLTDKTAGADCAGNLEVVGVTHGVSPYRHTGILGIHRACFFRLDSESHYPGAEPPRRIVSLFCAVFLLSRANWRARGILFSRPLR
jgi:hypothetical protein